MLLSYLIWHATEETRVAMGNRVLENIAAFFAGEEPGTELLEASNQ